MTTTLITDVQQGIIDQVDSLTLDAIIWDYLNNPDNGFMAQEKVIIITDATACTEVYYPAEDATSADTTACVFIDTTETSWVDTTALISVEQWKELYLENTYNDAMKTTEKIGFLDVNSPNYPLTGYEDILFNFDTAESLNYLVSPDTTADLYIEFRYPTAVKLDGMFFQGGEDGSQTFSGIATDQVILAGYVSYSKNGTDWRYLKNSVQYQINDSVAANATDADDAASSPFIFRQDTGFPNTDICNIVFNDVSLEAQYWRFHIVDLLPYLTSIGAEAGYTGSLAAVSHLRFEQFKLNGEFIVTQTLPGDSLQNGAVDTAQLADGSVTEEKLADFSIGNVKLDDGVTGIDKISRTANFTTLPTGQWSTMGATFSINGDDGYSKISIMFHCKSENQNAATTDGWRIQYISDSNVWTTVDTAFYPTVFTVDFITNSFPLLQSLVFTEGIRSNYARVFRVQSYCAIGDPHTNTLSVRALAVYAQ